MQKKILRPIGQILSNILIVLISLTITILLLELAVRIIAPQQLTEYRPDAYTTDKNGLGYRLRANIDTTMDRGEGLVSVITDENGHRIGRNTIRDADINILAIGDSFIEAVQVEYEQTMNALLENRLSGELSQTVRIVNTGVSGYDPNNYRAVMRRELENNRHYDALLVYIYVANDVINVSTPFLEPMQSLSFEGELVVPYTFDYLEIYNKVILPTHFYLVQHSHLYKLLHDRSRGLARRLGLIPNELIPQNYNRDYADSPDWTTTAQILNDIQQYSIDEGIPIIYVLLPAVYEIDADFFSSHGWQVDMTAYDMNQPETRLQEEMSAYGMTVIDMKPFLLKAFEAGNTQLYGTIDAHFAPAGHQVVADALYPELLSLFSAPN